MFSLPVESMEWNHPNFLQVQKLRPREAQALSQGDQLTQGAAPDEPHLCQCLAGMSAAGKLSWSLRG